MYVGHIQTWQAIRTTHIKFTCVCHVLKSEADINDEASKHLGHTLTWLAYSTTLVNLAMFFALRIYLDMTCVNTTPIDF